MRSQDDATLGRREEVVIGRTPQGFWGASSVLFLFFSLINIKPLTFIYLSLFFKGFHDDVCFLKFRCESKWAFVFKNIYNTSFRWLLSTFDYELLQWKWKIGQRWYKLWLLHALPCFFLSLSSLHLFDVFCLTTTISVGDTVIVKLFASWKYKPCSRHNLFHCRRA